MLDSKGNYIWIPLVAAKAQVLHAMVLNKTTENPDQFI